MYWNTFDCRDSMAGASLVRGSGLTGVRLPFFGGLRLATNFLLYDCCVMVELLPLDMPDTCVEPESTETREGFDRLRRLFTRRCDGPRFGLASGVFSVVVSPVVELLERSGVWVFLEGVADGRLRLRDLVSFTSSIRLSLGKKSAVSLVDSAEDSGEVDFGSVELGEVRWGRRPPLAL